MRGVATVTFIGTGASTPARGRWLPGILVGLRGEYILLDCGEGVQYRILSAGLRVNRLSAILITHMHGDHVYGLPGLLESLNRWGRAEKLTLVGPVDLEQLLDALKLRERLAYEVELVRARDCMRLQMGGYAIEAAAVEHGVEAYAYAIVEEPLPGTFDAERAEELGVPQGPLRSKLLRGEPVLLPGGRIVYPSDVVGPSRRGLKVTYSGDTVPCPRLVELARGSDVLIHEATFSLAQREEARLSFHSTAAGAAEDARRAGVGLLLLTHFSSRYGEEGVEGLLREARGVFRRAYAARDMMRVKLTRLREDWLLASFELLQGSGGLATSSTGTP